MCAFCFRHGRSARASYLNDEVHMAFPDALLVGVDFSGNLSSIYWEAGCEAVVWSLPVVKRDPATARSVPPTVRPVNRTS